MTFRSVIDSSGLLGEEHIFERITVTYSPSASLSEGSHRLTVIVPDYGGFSTTSTLDVISEDDSN